MEDESTIEMATKTLERIPHVKHFLHCLRGLSQRFVEADTARTLIAYYCLSGLDLLDVLHENVNEKERSDYQEWIWEQQIPGEFGGFKPGPSMRILGQETDTYAPYDPPHLIMTYTSLLALVILGDDFKRLNRKGLLKFLHESQLPDGSFTTTPQTGENDLRSLYCAFVISSLLNDWTSIDVNASLEFIKRCRTYEGGYGQTPTNESIGGTTYCALAAMALSPIPAVLSPQEKSETIRFLAINQGSPPGGFRGRTEKQPDACYSFWCGASLKLLGAEDVVNKSSNASFIEQCQFRFGGIAKFPEDTSDPFHTYISLAALSMYPPEDAEYDDSWKLKDLDYLINARAETAARAKEILRVV